MKVNSPDIRSDKPSSAETEMQHIEQLSTFIPCALQVYLPECSSIGFDFVSTKKT